MIFPTGDLPDLNSAYAEFERQQRELTEFQRKLATTTTTLNSANRMITVTLDGQGELKQVKFNTTAYRSMAPAELSAMVTDTLQRARAQSLETIQRLMGNQLGEVDLTDLANGTADLGDVLGTLLEPVLGTGNRAPDDEDDGWDHDR
ncbi:hypothetical protein GCM10011581_02890 [Saccharopolyspora subtropica]|uniref:Uncharacterized protein n=1 Tax=Saccharopolyspora thermophila TaxID=89367 RepID=A0A917JI63_9PSEU|nr:YbaB/EbfC family nucleoid-associated protein [Saccharopolyspora subtropica]GGI69306.1 hypothetical protein GCM10011581_02890 [Saccharopolyspora subtropica]